MSQQRKVSKGNVYHVISRGTGRQIIFENDDGRRFFLYLIRKHLLNNGAELYAWCLMSNHFHLLLHAELETISSCMRDICRDYAQWFNEKAGRTGHLFQERFRSEAIDSDAYLLTVIRYIHQNPVKAGISNMSDYPWSSYREYIEKPKLCEVGTVLAIFGGKRAFVEFHLQYDEKIECMDAYMSKNAKRSADDIRALHEIQVVMNDVRLTDLKTFSKKKRDTYLRSMKQAGLSIRQIERLTGIGRNTVAKA